MANKKALGTVRTRGRLETVASWATIVGTAITVVTLVLTTDVLSKVHTLSREFAARPLNVESVTLISRHSNEAALVGWTRVPNKSHYILTTALTTGTTWIQSEPVTVHSDGSISAFFSIGTLQEGCNQAFAVSVVAVDRKLAPGPLRGPPSELLPGALESNHVVIVRKDCS
jgi:hypothetical protein